MSKLLFAVAALAATTPLAAADRAEQRTMHVGYADLDLASDAGKVELDRRIAHAVREVCPDELTTALDKNLFVLRCRRDAKAAVAAQRDRAFAYAAAHGATIASSTGQSANHAN